MPLRIASMTGCAHDEAAREVEASIERLFTYGAWADKYDGAIHTTPMRGVTLAMHEPIGVMGLICPDECPLLGFVSLVAPAIAMGNTVIVVPSERHPLSATDFYSGAGDLRRAGGVVNIVTGRARRWRRCSPSTTTLTRSGASAPPRARASSRRPPPAT